jgi:hypothetical protein
LQLPFFTSFIIHKGCCHFIHLHAHVSVAMSLSLSPWLCPCPCPRPFTSTLTSKYLFFIFIFHVHVHVHVSWLCSCCTCTCKFAQKTALAILKGMWAVDLYRESTVALVKAPEPLFTFGDVLMTPCCLSSYRNDVQYSLQVTYKEIEEMIRTVDRNGDGRISYSEFRYTEIIFR